MQYSAVQMHHLTKIQSFIIQKSCMFSKTGQNHFVFSTYLLTVYSLLNIPMCKKEEKNQLYLYLSTSIKMVWERSGKQ